MYEFELAHTKLDKTKPYYDVNNGNIIMPKLGNKYSYYLETKIFNKDLNSYEYYLLLSNTKFDTNCYKCKSDIYNRIKIRLHSNEIKRDLTRHTLYDKYGFNIDVIYIESKENYDIYQIEII